MSDPIEYLLSGQTIRVYVPGVGIVSGFLRDESSHDLAAALRDAGLITRDEAADEVLAIGRYARTGPALNTARAAVEAAAEWVRTGDDQ